MPSAKFNKVYSDMGAFKDRSDKTGNPTNDEQLDVCINLHLTLSVFLLPLFLARLEVGVGVSKNRC